VRYVTSGDEEPAPWHEIVGVVCSLGMSQDPSSDDAGLYHVAVVAGVSVLLSVASLNALMAFIVAQRTREIGLRSALGAEAGRIVSVIAGRAFAQLAVGVLIAVLAGAVIVTKGLPADPATAGWPLALAGAAAIVLLVGMLACVGPTLRGLRIRPVEALKS
jgi:ABC-type antimicrobial peptide transport system permease subunit